MKHANSNVNILKKKKISKTIKINNFLRPPSISNNFISPITAKNSNNKNILYNLLYKDTSKISLYNTKNTTNTFKNNNEISTIGGGKYSFNNKNLSNNSTSMGNSINIKEDRIYKENISIRLKLNSKIFNSNNKNKVKSNTINNDLIEKIKEKDIYINKLQKELFQTKEFLNNFHKEMKLNNNFDDNQQIKTNMNMNILNIDEKKGNNVEGTIDRKDKKLKLNSVKFEVSKSNSKIKNKNLNYDYSNHKNNNSYSKKNFEALSRIDSFINLNININNNKNKRNNKNQKSNNCLNINNYQYSFPTNNFMKCIRCFSSSTNRGFRSGKGRYESYKLLPKKISKNRNKEVIKLTQRKENNNHDNKKEISYNTTTLKDLIAKCNSLKSRANIILSNYISLTESLINISNSAK
jgi:hypothetical protein